MINTEKRLNPVEENPGFALVTTNAVPSGARIWGILSEDDRRAGFELILDHKDRLFLLKNGNPLVRFHPSCYTMSELIEEIKALTRVARSPLFHAVLRSAGPRSPS